MNTPDKWMIVRIADDTSTIYKVLGSWFGGYLSGNSWMLNSGIEKAEDLGDKILFHGYSGSVYECYKHVYGCHMLAYSVYMDMRERAVNTKDTIEALDEKEALSLDWINK